MEKVLVVEDNPDNMRLIKKILEHGGYSVSGAAIGADGLELAAKHRFEFIIIDINLPDMDGLELAKQLRSKVQEPGVPIIAITSNALRGDRAKILQAGCDGYFEKPIDPLTILDDIRRIIGEET